LLDLGSTRMALSPLENSMRTEVVLALEYITGNLAAVEELVARNPGNPLFRSQVVFRKGDWELAFKQLRDSVESFRRNQELWNLCSTLCLLFDLFVIVEEYQAAAALMPEVLAAHQPADFYWEIYSRPSMALLAINSGRTHEAHEHIG